MSKKVIFNRFDNRVKIYNRFNFCSKTLIVKHWEYDLLVILDNLYYLKRHIYDLVKRRVIWESKKRGGKVL